VIAETDLSADHASSSITTLPLIAVCAAITTRSPMSQL
jgi:hypothetical protein